MKNIVYAIIDYNVTAHTNAAIGLYATEKLAIEQLRRWRKAIEAGKWDGTTFVKWHDSDAEEVTWMRIMRKGYNYSNGVTVTNEHCYTVESVPVKETENDLYEI